MASERMTPDQETLKRLREEEVAQARATSPEDKVRAGLELFDLVCRVMEDGIRSEHPEADEASIRQMLRERLERVRRRENPQ